jgi:hypothetical protein
MSLISARSISLDSIFNQPSFAYVLQIVKPNLVDLFHGHQKEVLLHRTCWYNIPYFFPSLVFLFRRDLKQNNNYNVRAASYGDMYSYQYCTENIWQVRHILSPRLKRRYRHTGASTKRPLLRTLLPYITVLVCVIPCIIYS